MTTRMMTRLHHRILDALREQPRTPDEIAEALGLVLNTSRARITELIQWRYAYRTDETRDSEAGTPVYVVAARPVRIVRMRDGSQVIQ